MGESDKKDEEGSKEIFKTGAKSSSLANISEARRSTSYYSIHTDRGVKASSSSPCILEADVIFTRPGNLGGFTIQMKASPGGLYESESPAENFKEGPNKANESDFELESQNEYRREFGNPNCQPMMLRCVCHYVDANGVPICPVQNDPLRGSIISGDKLVDYGKESLLSKNRDEESVKSNGSTDIDQEKDENKTYGSVENKEELNENDNEMENVKTTEFLVEEQAPKEKDKDEESVKTSDYLAKEEESQLKHNDKESIKDSKTFAEEEASMDIDTNEESVIAKEYFAKDEELKTEDKGEENLKITESVGESIANEAPLLGNQEDKTIGTEKLGANNESEPSRSQVAAASKTIHKSQDIINTSVSSIMTSSTQMYNEVIEALIQQNCNMCNLDKMKEDLMCPATCDTLNELIAAIVIQCKSRWPELLMPTNEYNNFTSIQPSNIVNQARDRLQQIKKSETACQAKNKEDDQSDSNNQEEIEGILDFCASTESINVPIKNTSYRNKDDFLRKLLEKADIKNRAKFGQQTSCCNETKDLNDQIIGLLKKRRKYLQQCNKCTPRYEFQEKLECISNELCKLCNKKLKYLNRRNRELGSVKTSPNNRRVQIKAFHSDFCYNTEDSSNFQPFNCCDDDELPITYLIDQAKEALCCDNDQFISQLKQEHEECCRQNNDLRTTNLKKQQNEKCCSATEVLSLFESMSADLKELKRNHSCRGCKSETSAGIVFESQQLKEELQELKAEREEFKYILREQECQMEDYRQRYLKAKQTVEEQFARIKQLEKCNDFVEDQIAYEIEKVKNKFEQKVKELPVLLEQETKKLKQSCKEKEELKEKLTIVCGELHKLKENLKSSASSASEDQRSEMLKLKTDLQAALEAYKTTEKKNTLQTGEIKSLRAELATLRKETASILSRSKERMDRQKADISRKIHELEDELVKERAFACLAIKEKEKVNKHLENIMCDWKASQGKVKTLQNYIKCLMDQLHCHIIRRKNTCHKDN